MYKFEFCLPTRAEAVPALPEWFHEVKYDGYRLRLEREGALKNRQRHFVVDGEAVILGVDGRSDFNALHSNRQNEEVQLCAFDLLAMGGEDLPHPAALDAQDQS